MTVNRCLLCHGKAEPLKRSAEFPHYDKFKCRSEFCGVEFHETGTGAELVPARFNVNSEYRMSFMHGNITMRLSFRVTRISVWSIDIEVKTSCGVLFHIVDIDLRLNWMTDCFLLPRSLRAPVRGLAGNSGFMYPYNRRKND